MSCGLIWDLLMVWRWYALWKVGLIGAELSHSLSRVHLHRVPPCVRACGTLGNTGESLENIKWIKVTVLSSSMFIPVGILLVMGKVVWM